MGEKTLINEAGECGPYQPGHAVYFLCDVFYHFVVNGGFTWIRLSRCVAVCFLRVCGDGCRLSRSMVDLEQLNVFVFPYRIGERIRVVDKDEDISGVIIEIALFHVLILRDNGDTITYPNNLMLQKAVLKLADQSPLAERQALQDGKKKLDLE